MNVKGPPPTGPSRTRSTEKKKVTPSKPEAQDVSDLNAVDQGLDGYHLDKFQGHGQGGQSSGQGQQNAWQPILPGSPPPGAYGTSLGSSNALSITDVTDLPKAGSVTSNVQSSLPLDALTEVGKTPSGAVFHLDSSLAAAMEVKVRQIVTPTMGPATELNARLTHAESMELANRLAAMPDVAQTAFQIEKADFDGQATAMEASEAYVPNTGSGWPAQPLKAHRVESERKFVADYVPSTGNPQAYRDRLRIRAFGSNDAERKANLELALSKLGLNELVADADPLQTQRLVRLSMLRMVAPEPAEQLGLRLKDVSLSELDAALAQHGVGPERLAQLKIEEVFPGHMAVVDPSLGKAYAEKGIRALMVGVRSLDSVTRILTSDGLMSSIERYGRGLHRPGASLASDEATGGAEFAFVRMVTPSAMSGAASISNSYAAGMVQLLSVGEPMQAQLSRTDWHAYPFDSFGISIGKWQADSDSALELQYNTYACKFTSRPVLDDLVAQVNGDVSPPETWSGGGFQTANEACFKAGVPARAFTHAVVADEATRALLVQLLEENGLTRIGGKPLEQAVIVAEDWKQVGDQLGLSN
ncbi:MAG: hypothetical protein WBV82_00790 [Myxococcaceae bacterium]